MHGSVQLEMEKMTRRTRIASSRSWSRSCSRMHDSHSRHRSQSLSAAQMLKLSAGTYASRMSARRQRPEFIAMTYLLVGDGEADRGSPNLIVVPRVQPRSNTIMVLSSTLAAFLEEERAVFPTEQAQFTRKVSKAPMTGKGDNRRGSMLNVLVKARLYRIRVRSRSLRP